MGEFLQTRRLRALLPFIVWVLTTTGIAFSQTDASSVIVRGRVEKTHASAEPLLAPSNRTAIITVEEMFAGSEIAGDQKGLTCTVILSRPDKVRSGEVALFFGNPLFVGNSLTIADESEIAISGGGIFPAVQGGAQARKDKPVRDRLATANMVFRGTVESVKPLALRAATEQGKRTPEPPSEHDPEWQVAAVRIVTPINGGVAGKVITIVFAASRDITWFNSPKLKQGQDAVFIAHAPNKEEETIYRGSGLDKFLENRPVYLVTEPFDVLPPTDESRVRGLLATPKETR